MNRELIENECDILRLKRKDGYLIDSDKMYIVTDIDDDMEPEDTYVLVEKIYIKELEAFIAKVEKVSRANIEDIISLILENKLNVLPTNYAIISDNILGVEAETIPGYTGIRMYAKCGDRLLKDEYFYLNNFEPDIKYFSEEEDQKIAEAIWNNKKDLVSKLSDENIEDLKSCAKKYLSDFDDFNMYMDPEEYFCCFYNEKLEEYSIFFYTTNESKLYYINNNDPDIEYHQSYAYNLGKIIIEAATNNK